MNEEQFTERKLVNYKIFLASIIVIITIALTIFLIILFTQSVKCNKNPFVYGASEFAEDYKGEVLCNCYITGEKFLEFSFTDKEFNPTKDEDLRPMNLSNLQW